MRRLFVFSAVTLSASAATIRALKITDVEQAIWLLFGGAAVLFVAAAALQVIHENRKRHG